MEWNIGWDIIEFLISGTIYNIVAIIFGLIAWNKAAQAKKYGGYIAAGLLLNSIPYFGFFSGLKRNPESYIKLLDSTIGELVYLAIYICLILFVCSKAYKEAVAKQETAVKEVPENTSESK